MHRMKAGCPGTTTRGSKEGTMRALRWMGAGLVGLVAGILGLVGVILCVTVVLLPLGIPVLFLARKLYGVAAALVLPRAVRHPLGEMGKRGSAMQDDATSKVDKAGKALRGKRRTWYGRKRKTAWQKAPDWVTS